MKRLSLILANAIVLKLSTAEKETYIDENFVPNENRGPAAKTEEKKLPFSLPIKRII